MPDGEPVARGVEGAGEGVTRQEQRCGNCAHWHIGTRSEGQTYESCQHIANHPFDPNKVRSRETWCGLWEAQEPPGPAWENRYYTTGELAYDDVRTLAKTVEDLKTLVYQLYMNFGLRIESWTDGKPIVLFEENTPQKVAAQWNSNESWLRPRGFTREGWLERSGLVRGQILGALYFSPHICTSTGCRCWNTKTKECGAPDTGGPELCSDLDKLCGGE